MPYLCQQSINIHRFNLAKSVHSKYGLHIMRRIPRCVKDDNTVCTHQIGAQRTSSRGDEEETRPGTSKNKHVTVKIMYSKNVCFQDCFPDNTNIKQLGRGVNTKGVDTTLWHTPTEIFLYMRGQPLKFVFGFIFKKCIKPIALPVIGGIIKHVYITLSEIDRRCPIHAEVVKPLDPGA